MINNDFLRLDKETTLKRNNINIIDNAVNNNSNFL
jgi:hypothetical protein